MIGHIMRHENRLLNSIEEGETNDGKSKTRRSRTAYIKQITCKMILTNYIYRN